MRTTSVGLDWNTAARRNGGVSCDVAARLIAALEPDDTVLGGGNVKKLDELPPHCRAGDNANAFRGGFRLWGKENALLHTRGHSKQRA